MKYRISVNKATCIGCGACTSVSENFIMDEKDEVKAKVVDPDVADLKLNEREAEEVCPVDAIQIEEMED